MTIITPMIMKMHLSLLQTLKRNPKFNRLVEEIMRRDRQYFFQVIAQSGMKLPHDFDVSQIIEEDPNQGNQTNANPRGHNGDNRRECFVLESPSSLFQKLEVPNTYAHANFTRNSHEQLHSCPFLWRRTTNTHDHDDTQDHTNAYN